jgi:hypothetical protein
MEPAPRDPPAKLDAAPVTVAPTSPASPSPTVTIWRWTLPRASGAERLAWAALLVLSLSLLATAASIKPDPRGYGTHEQIRIFGHALEPCGFKVMFGKPCPSCGFTTTFALATHGRPIDAARNQPFGFLVFLLTVSFVPLSFCGSVLAASAQPLFDRLPWGRIGLVMLGLWLLAWAYKVAVTT